MRHGIRAGTVLALAALVGPAGAAPGSAQIRASERGSVSQVVDGTTITVDYGRPQARGRSPIFGNVVRWGEVWTPGANWATTFEVDRDVRVEGTEVPAGRYSVWMIPGEELWTVQLHGNPRIFHSRHPDPEDAFASWETTPEEVEPREVLTFAFPEIRRDGATLEFRWGTVRLALDVAVRPSRPDVALTEEDVAPYLGDYALTMVGPRGESPPMDLEVVLRDGRLVASVNEGMFEMEFIPDEEPHRFWPAFVEDGQVVDVEQFPVTFHVVDGRATGYTVPGVEEGSVWMRAVREEGGGGR